MSWETWLYVGIIALAEFGFIGYVRWRSHAATIRRGVSPMDLFAPAVRKGLAAQCRAIARSSTTTAGVAGLSTVKLRRSGYAWMIATWTPPDSIELAAGWSDTRWGARRRYRQARQMSAEHRRADAEFRDRPGETTPAG